VNISDELATTSGQMKRLQVKTQLMMQMAATGAAESGKMMFHRMANSDEPSTRAASMSSSGMPGCSAA